MITGVLLSMADKLEGENRLHVYCLMNIRNRTYRQLLYSPVDQLFTCILDMHVLRQPRHDIADTRPSHHLADLFISRRTLQKNAAFLPTLAEHATDEMGKGCLALSRGIPAPTWLGCQHSHVRRTVVTVQVLRFQLSRCCRYHGNNT